MQIISRVKQPFYPRFLMGMILITVASMVIMSWIWWGGPNSDTILTYHRNHLAQSWMEMLQLLVGQDQAPLPQFFHYALHVLGFSSVIALQVSSSLITVLALFYILAWDLNADSRYQQLSYPLWIYTFTAIAMLISPSFSAALTWVRYAVLIGIAWYGVWVLEEYASQAKQPNPYIFSVGLALGLGCLISYTWGVVVVASGLSLLFNRQLKRSDVLRNLVFGAIPGLIVTVGWLMYAGTAHLNFILLRTHGTALTLMKSLGKSVFLLTYPFVGGLFFPSLITLLIVVMTVSILGYGVYIYLRNEPTRTFPFFCHLFLSIPLYLVTNVTVGYGMIGPGLILMSCAIKGIIRLSRPPRLCLMTLLLVTLLAGMIANIEGKNVISAIFSANKSREAIQTIISRLVSENALNNHTLVIAGDESSRVLIESIPAVQRRFAYELTSNGTSAPNLVALLRMAYRQDKITPNVDRIMIILVGATKDMFTEQDQYLQQWLSTAHFSHLVFKKEIGAYSSWMKRITNTVAPAQYVVEEWVK